MLDMVLRGFIAVEDGVLRMAKRDLRFVSRLRVFLRVVVLGGLAVMARRLFVVVGGGGVVLRAAEVCLDRSCEFE